MFALSQLVGLGRRRARRRSAEALARAIVPVMEAMESRRMLTVSCGSLSSGALTVTGDGNSEAITVETENSTLFVKEGVTTRCSHTESQVTDLTINMGGGTDTVTIDVSVGSGVHITINGGDGADTLNGGNDAETINGEAGADSIKGGGGADSLTGGTDNDTLEGEAGADTLSGGDNADRLLGGTENDSLVGGNDNDYLVGGADNDEISAATTTTSLRAAAAPTLYGAAMATTKSKLIPRPALRTCCTAARGATRSVVAAATTASFLIATTCFMSSRWIELRFGAKPRGTTS